MQINPMTSIPGIQTDAPVVRPKSSSVDSPTLKNADNAKVPVDSGAVRAATDKLNRTMEALGNNLQFTVDSETSMRVVRVVDKATNETIRQFPSEEAVNIAKTLDRLQGLLFRDIAG